MPRAYFDEVERYRVRDRKIDEFIGVTRLLASKPVLDQEDVHFLDLWMSTNQQIANEPLVSEIYDQVDDLLGNPPATAHDLNDLLAAVQRFAGSVASNGAKLPTSLPLDDPAPQVEFSGKRFCFTGLFTFGKRSECEQAVRDRGADVGEVSIHTDFLVIGSQANATWKHSGFGNKIMKAVAWRDNDGHDIAIISEVHWIRFL